jgi:hypothetical protein
MDLNTDKLEELILERLQVKFDFQYRLSLLLTLTGEKPGARVAFVDESKKELIEEFCGEFDLHFRSFETGLHHKYYLTTREELFNHLERMEGNEPYFTAESEGKFLGYPENAISHYTAEQSSRKLERDVNRKVDEMVESGRVEEENLYLLDLVLFIPEPSERGIVKALEKGETRKEHLKHFDRIKDSSVGKKLLEEVRNRSKPYFRDIK